MLTDEEFKKIKEGVEAARPAIQMAADYREALLKIANDPHCCYKLEGGQYEIGVADGHRCAARIARSVLGMPVND
jgi:hypothetical protein